MPNRKLVTPANHDADVLITEASRTSSLLNSELVGQIDSEPTKKASHETPAHQPGDGYQALLKHLNAVNEYFASASIVLSRALQSGNKIWIAANMAQQSARNVELSCWTCTHDEQGLDLTPLDITSSQFAALDGQTWAEQLIGPGKKGDVLLVCDPWGDHDLLCWAVRLATRREVTTIAVTTDQPNFLSVLSHYPIKIPAVDQEQREPVMTVLQHLIQTAGIGVIPAQRRATGPLRPLPFEV